MKFYKFDDPIDAGVPEIISYRFGWNDAIDYVKDHMVTCIKCRHLGFKDFQGICLLKGIVVDSDGFCEKGEK